MSDVTRSHGIFDQFAAVTSKHLSRAWFFAACVFSVLLWAVSGPIFAFSEGWQLVINTGTTILTFLLVALIQNTQERSTKALSHKLDAIATGLALVLEDTSEGDSASCVEQLREIAGVEMEPSK